ACGLGQVAGDPRAQRFGVVEGGGVERVEVELERLGFDQVRGRGGYGESGGGDQRLAARVQPRQFVGVPAVVAGERQRAVHRQPLATGGARDREQQGRVVVRGVGDFATEQRVFGAGHRGILSPVRVRRSGFMPGKL